MSKEYIERDVALQLLHSIGGCGAEKDSYADGWDKAIDEAYRQIQNEPAADVVPVVRCKDCEWHRDEGLCMNPHCGKSFYGCHVPPDHFCSYGEAKEVIKVVIIDD